MRMKLLKKRVKKKQAKSGCEQKWYCKSGYFKLVIKYHFLWSNNRCGY